MFKFYYVDYSISNQYTEIIFNMITSELKIFLSDEEKFGVMEKVIAAANFDQAEDIMTIDGLRVNFADGWGLVRSSNTTP